MDGRDDGRARASEPRKAGQGSKRTRRAMASHQMAVRATVLARVAEDLLSRLYALRREALAADRDADLGISEKMAKRLLDKFPEDTLKGNEPGYDVFARNAELYVMKWEPLYIVLQQVDEFRGHALALLAHRSCVAMVADGAVVPFARVSLEIFVEQAEPSLKTTHGLAVPTSVAQTHGEISMHFALLARLGASHAIKHGLMERKALGRLNVAQSRAYRTDDLWVAGRWERMGGSQRRGGSHIRVVHRSPQGAIPCNGVRCARDHCTQSLPFRFFRPCSPLLVAGGDGR